MTRPDPTLTITETGASVKAQHITNRDLDVLRRAVERRTKPVRTEGEK